jgi:iron complex outermembrane receptor protein
MLSMSTLKNVSMGIFALSLAIETPNVLAQVTPSSPSIEEIVVTAQKRSENVMDVPISIAALSTESLERSNIDSMDDIQTIVPGVELRRQVSSLAPFIRGVGSQNATVIGFEPSVALYVDGIYQSQPANNGIGYHHLERIEVLKGPQGTLFGRNASGGAISIVTKDPDHDLSGSAEIGYGNYDTTTADLYITTGITDTLATNLAVSYLDQSEGFGKNVFLDEEVNKQRIFSIRNKWLWKPSEGTEARLTLAYSESQDSPGRARGIYPGTTNFFGFSSLPDFYDVQENYTGGKDTGNSQVEGEAAATESFGATLRMDKDFGPFTLVSITGYLNQEAFFTVDSDFSPAPVLDANLPFYTDQISQRKLPLIVDSWS